MNTSILDVLTLLPADLKPNKEAFISLGFSFGAEAKDGPYPYLITVLPNGWRAEDNGHQRYSFIKDCNGYTRAEYFRAQPHSIWDKIIPPGSTELLRRYIVGAEYEPSGHRFGDLSVGIRDNSSGKMVVKIGVAPRDEKGHLDWETYDQLRTSALNELNTRYPQHEDPLAYW